VYRRIYTVIISILHFESNVAKGCARRATREAQVFSLVGCVEAV
jgi:hypothetical protein